MKPLREALIATGAGLALLIAPLGTASAQTAETVIALDGRTLTSQDQSTQQNFISVWGSEAPMRWSKEHTAELQAQGLTANPSRAQILPGAGGSMAGGQTEVRHRETPPDQSRENVSNSHKPGDAD